MIFRDATSVETAVGTTKKVGLRVFIEVSSLLKTFRTVDNGNATVRNVLDVLELTGLTVSDDHTLEQVLSSATDVIIAMDDIYANMPPIFNPKGSQKKAPPPVEEPWDYNERVEISVWVHRIASAYHWTRDTILELDPVEAARYIQEIEIDHVHNREFIHSLSEVAYQYDTSSRTSKYRPLTRPNWMIRRTVEMPKPQKIPRRFMPVGLVINAEYLEEMEKNSTPS